MSRRPRSNASPISLFTFLDTLMCTMGALILLLIGMAIRMRPDANLEDMFAPVPAVQSAEAAPLEAEPTVPSPPRYTAEDRARDLAERAARRERRAAESLATVVSVESERDLAQKELQNRRRMIAKAEKKLRETQARAERAGSQTESAEQAQAAAAATEQKLRSLEEQVVEQIEVTRRNLDLANRKQANASNEYALVPYDGTSGTMRRPIYIECTRHGYRFIPENEFVGPEHLDGFSESYNPLLTGTQALLRYWNARRRESGGTEPEPYVLLIVRPSGSLAYYLARKLLAPIGANFGYELVEEDWKLATSDADPQARAVLHDAIEITVEAREKVRDTLAKSASGRNGAVGFNSNHRAISRSDLAEGFDSPSAAPGRGGGRRAGDPGADGPDNRNPFGQGGSVPSSGTTAGAGAGGRDGPTRAYADRRGGPVTGGARGSSGPGGMGDVVSDSDETSPGNGTGRGSRALTSRGAGNGSQSSNGDGSGLEAFGEASDGQALRGTGDSTEGTGNSRNGVRRGRLGGARAATLGGRDADLASDGASDDGSGAGSARSRPSGPSRAGSDGGEEPTLVPLPEEVGPPRGNSPRYLVADQARPPGRLRSLEPDGDGTGTGGSGEGEPGGAQKGAQNGTSARRSSSRGGGSGAPGGGAVGEENSGMITLGSSDGGGSGENQPRGGKRNWGKPASRGGIGLEKEVEIHAKADRLLVGPNDAAIPVSPSEKTDEIVKRIMVGIDEVAHRWGDPPANFYYLPAVKFVVYPGGNGYYERLRGPLEKLGVRSTVQYIAATTTARSPGGARK